MTGWIYLIRNGDLYKIGITKNFDNRMRQLKPDYVVAKLYSSNFKQLERELHKKYKNVRIPQTEYFRLDNNQIREIKKTISKLYFSKNLILIIFCKSFIMLLSIFVILLPFRSLFINEIDILISSSLLLIEKLSYGFSFLSFFLNSDKYLSLFNDVKLRLIKGCLFILLAFLFRFASSFF